MSFLVATQFRPQESLQPNARLLRGPEIPHTGRHLQPLDPPAQRCGNKVQMCHNILIGNASILGTFGPVTPRSLNVKDRQSSSITGSKNSPYLRILPPAYGDGVFLPRCFILPLLFKILQFQGRELARGSRTGIPELTSLTTCDLRHNYEGRLPIILFINERSFREGDQNETESKTNTHMLMQWGQVGVFELLSKASLYFGPA